VPPVTEPREPADDAPAGRGAPARLVNRAAVLSRLTNLYAGARYLEIGVAEGTTFFKVPAARKVAVDPEFRFDVAERRRVEPHADFHEVASDDYFASVVGPDEQFDVIYLDGLHVYEQTLRDLMNALHHLQPRGVVVVDDTHPPTHMAAINDLDHYVRMRDYLGSDDRRWMGDVFKLVWFVEAFMPHLTYRTIANNHGQTVLWRSRRADYPRRTLQQVAHLTFEQMVVEEDVLRLQAFGEIRRELRRDLGI
jgi:SAM-dependent methyltransferase